jgi:hypothetical protein
MSCNFEEQSNTPSSSSTSSTPSSSSPSSSASSSHFSSSSSSAAPYFSFPSSSFPTPNPNSTLLSPPYWGVGSRTGLFILLDKILRSIRLNPNPNLNSNFKPSLDNSYFLLNDPNPKTQDDLNSEEDQAGKNFCRVRVKVRVSILSL